MSQNVCYSVLKLNINCGFGNGNVPVMTALMIHVPVLLQIGDIPHFNTAIVAIRGCCHIRKAIPELAKHVGKNYHRSDGRCRRCLMSGPGGPNMPPSQA